MRSTYVAAGRNLSSVWHETISDPAALKARVVESDAPHVVLTTTSPGIPLPKAWIVFCPADDIEVEKVVSLAEKLARPVLIGIRDAPTPQSTAPSDVIEVGWPNIYATGDDVVFISTGPVLHAVREAAQQMREVGLSTGVVHLPTVQPLYADEIAGLIRSARGVVLVVGHPLGEMLPERLGDLLGPTAHAVVRTPSVESLISAAHALLSEKTPTAGRMRFAERMSRLGTETAFDVLAEVNRLRAEGHDIISFAIGEPDFPSPSNVKRAGIRAIEEDKTHYSESAGIPELRQAIAEYIRRTRGIEVGPEHVVVTPGAKPILFNTLAATVNPDEEVIYPNPGFPIYESLIEFIGAKAVPLPLREELGFNFDPDEFRRLVTDKTRLIILNTPHNPTGAVLSEESLRVVAEVAAERDIWVLADEVYSQMVYDGAFTSIAALPGMAERTVILDGFSKTYSMTGWRLGFGVMPPELARLEARIETNLNSCTATFVQWAGVEALTGPQDESQAMIAEFKRRRELIVEGLNAIPGFSCLMPGGAFYIFPNVTEACRMIGAADSREFQQALLHEAHVAVLARTAFGRALPDERQEYVRFSYATSAELIAQGLERIRSFMSR